MSLQELRQALRSIAKARGFTATVLLTLGVCLGANTAIFTIVNSVLLRPIPVPGGEDLVILSNRYPNAGVRNSFNSGVVDYFERRSALTGLEEQAIFRQGNDTVEIQGTPQRVEVTRATPAFFRLLKVVPALGRDFQSQDGEPGSERKVILSHGMFQQLFAGDPSAIGRQLRISGRNYEVIGVMPPSFRFVYPDTRLWMPLAFSAKEKVEGRHSNNFLHVGRLKPGSSVPQVKSQVDALNRANLERAPEWREILTNAGFHTAVEPLHEMLVGDIRRMLYVLWAGAVCVLLIGVLNLANLSLARLNLRAKEIATRLALGASQWQVVKHFLAESLMVALTGGALGVGFAWGILEAIHWMGIEQLPKAMVVQLDRDAVLYSIAISVAVGLAMGLMPVFRLFRADLAGTLRSESRGGTTGKAARAVRRGLVVAQVAFGFLLLAGAGLLTASFRQLLAVDPGFRADGVSTAALRLPSARYSDPQKWRDFHTRLLDSLRAQPGIVSAGTTNIIPFGSDRTDSVILPEGYAGKAGESLIAPFYVRISVGYFETMGIGLRRGRYFEARDNEKSMQVAIVDESLAKRFWPDMDPVGKRMFFPEDIKNLTGADANRKYLTVVGVVADVRMVDMGTPSPVGAYYLPSSQSPLPSMTIVAKSVGSSGGSVDAIRRTVSTLDPELALFDVRTMGERTQLSLSARRAAMLLSTSFGIVALFLTAIGIYGVLAYLVSTRIREIGIRLALGASTGSIFWLVLREGVVLVGTGVLLGVAGAFAMRKGLESQMYGISAADPVVLSATVVVLALAALIASSMPASRAMRVDPVQTLSES